jgi:hypothetical protein
LKELSRLAIRRSLPDGNLVRHVPAFPLPESVKRYALFADVKALAGVDDADDVSDRDSFDSDFHPDM